MNHLLSPSEKALINGSHNFSKDKQRYLRYRIRKKLRLVEEEGRSAAAALPPRYRSPNNLPTTSMNIGTLIQEALTRRKVERGSPSLVGRGIANPMSERTRGFEMLLMDGNAKVPLPALFSLAIFMNFLNITASVVD
jgi:hypothetical protein